MTEDQAKVLGKAIVSWESLTGSHLMSNKQNMLTFVAVETIKEAFKLDETGATALLILNAETERYAEQVSYSVKDMVDDSETVVRRVQAFSDIRRTLKNPAFSGIIESFKTSLAKALEFYGCMTPAVQDLVNDQVELAYIRRDALRAIEILREDVFLKGEPEAGPMKFNPGMYLFWNINSLLRILGNTRDSGVTLCLIQETEANASHFAFAIRNGNNLVLLSDKPKFANPEQATLQSMRGGFRELAHRMKQLRFPYEFMGAWIGGKGRGEMNIPGATMPVPAQQEAIKLSEMKDLPPATLIWLTMLFELIANRYWKNADQVKAGELSYTGEMIEQPLALPEGCQALAVRDYKPLKFNTFTTASVLSDKVQFQVRKTGQNRWMEEKYKAQVPEALLNPLPSSNPQLPEHLLPAVPTRGLITRQDVEKERQRLVPVKLHTEYWGTQEELQHTHMWVARKNFATAIGRLAVEEFQREHEAVKKWYVEKVAANRDFWLRGLAVGELMLPNLPPESSHFESRPRPVERIQQNALAFYPSGAERHWLGLRGGIPFHNGYCRQQDEFFCYLSPKNMGREMAHIQPKCPEALALLAGCKVEDLPIFLQNWFSHDIYSGNHILSDVDPLEVVDNPWIDGFHPDMFVRFGRKGLYRLQRTSGLPKRLPWNEAKAAPRQ